MPFGRFMARIKRYQERAEHEAKQQEQRHRLGLWVNARSLYHALTADKAMPQTKAEQKKEVQDSEIQEAKAWREKHDAEWRKALSNPYHLETLVGFEAHVFPEPPSEEEQAKTRAEYYKQKNKEAMAAARRMLEKSRARRRST